MSEERFKAHVAVYVLLERHNQIFLLRRQNTGYMEGKLCFPSGHLDGEETVTAAAIRECAEESGLMLKPDNLIYYSHWLPPLEAPKRYSTWFFLTEAPEGEVEIDDGEITDHSWRNPNEALQMAHEKSIEILPPTWITLFDLSQFTDTSTAVKSVQSRGPRAYATKIVPTDDGLAAIWEGDNQYSDDPSIPETQKHRLVMADPVWKFQFGKTDD